MNTHERLHALDAVRAFALLLGILFHAGFSFIPGMIPGIWAITDTSPSTAISAVLFVSHIFRMSLFFFIAGFFARMMFHRKGARGFWADRAKRILVPLVVGWMILFPAIAVVWVWGLTKTFGSQMPAPPAHLTSRPGAFPLTHLWFLYYLLVLYGGVTLVRRAVVAFDSAGSFRRSIDRAIAAIAGSGSAAIALALPVSLALYFRASWFSWFGIPTPDQSLIPELTSLVAYGTAIAFGWLVHRQANLLQVWQRQWPGHLAAAVAMTIVCLSIAGVVPTLAPAARGPQTMIYAACYALAIWCWVFATIGIAQRYLSSESAVRRYVADSSYWLYLVHLPVVAAFQVLVGHLPWHWSVKLPIILAASFAVLFGSYHLLVRFTFIGAVLNGHRYRRGSEPPKPEPVPVDDECLVRLKGVHKKYGKAVALAGIDLEVRRGELVALLGPNGAGKTTANSIMLGLLQPDEGEVRLMGRSPLDVESRRGVGVMLQEVTLPVTVRVREHVELAASYYPDPLSADEAMTMTGTTVLARRKYGALSAGQKRQVQLAIAICGRPRLLFLDEPTVGLDVQSREAMWSAMRALVAAGSSIVLTTHYLEEVEALANRVVVLAHGRVIASGSVDEIRGVVSRKRITCSSQLTADEVSGWPHVVEATADARRMQITATDAEAVVRQLLATDGALRDLEVRQAGLNEAFTELTKEAA